MFTEAKYTMTCTKCRRKINKGETINLTSGNRASHRHGCPAQEPTVVRQQPALDSYEQECEDEGIRMGYRSY